MPGLPLPLPKTTPRLTDPAARAVPALVAAWVVFLATGLLGPVLIGAGGVGDAHIRSTIWVALLYYGGAAVLLLLLRPEEWAAGAGRVRLARCCWTLAWASYLLHVIAAFHHYHHWSHASAVEHTRAVSGAGWGVYVTHVFTLTWTLDVALWWLWPRRYAGRPSWVGAALHGFLAFILFNGSVVYETGPVRWAGAALFAGLGVLWLRRLASRRGTGKG